MSLEILIDRIVKSTKHSQEDVEELILKKQQELTNLVSKEGAAYIVAKELGLDLVERKRVEVKVKDIAAGRAFTLHVRVIRVFPAKEYDGKTGKFKVGNVILANPGTLGGMFQKASFAVYDTGAKNLELKILETL